VTSLGGGSFGVNGSHTYVNVGSYAASVNIQDAGGSIASLNDTVTVTPEPATWLGAAAGLLVIACRRRLAPGVRIC
jgi:hypothetical protein